MRMAIITMKKKQRSDIDIINFINENFNCIVSDRLIRKIVQRYNETGNLTDRRRSGRPTKMQRARCKGCSPNGITRSSAFATSSFWTGDNSTCLSFNTKHHS